MSLKNNADWICTSVHEVVAEFLLGERQEKFGFVPPGTPFIDAPNVNDPRENHTRLRLLYFKRAQFFGEIPPDTRWHEVKTLTDNELDELHVVAYPPFMSKDDKNELRRVAARLPEALRTQPGNWRRPILWGHEKSGPFSIFEGNHRLIAYASAPSPPGLDIPVFVGLSDTPCMWHIHDAVQPLANHLWKPDSCWPTAFPL
jgi:hypothetical protein